MGAVGFDPSFTRSVRTSRLTASGRGLGMIRFSALFLFLPPNQEGRARLARLAGHWVISTNRWRRALSRIRSEHESSGRLAAEL